MLENSSYLSKCFTLIGKLADRFQEGELDEQAIPAYTAGNLLSRELFKFRLNIAMRFIEQSDNDGLCLDFGCGSGIMLPWLSARYTRVIGIDIDTRISNSFLKSYDFTNCPGSSKSRISLKESIEDAGLVKGSVDLIVVLDVLEHFDNPAKMIEQLSRLLTPGGTLIVSGPTENWLYKVGRKIVGFDGHYHHWNIAQIKKMVECVISVEKNIPVFPLLHFFDVFVAKNSK